MISPYPSPFDVSYMPLPSPIVQSEPPTPEEEFAKAVQEIDCAKIIALIPQMAPSLIKNEYIQILNSSSLSGREQAKLAKIFLIHGRLSDEEKRGIGFYSNIMSELDPDFLFNLATSCNQPVQPILNHLAFRDPRNQKILQYCWDHQLVNSIQAFLLHNENCLIPLIQQENMNEKFILNLFRWLNIETKAVIFEKLPKSPTFFDHEDVKQYLESGNAPFSALEMGFDHYWNHIEPLDEDDLILLNNIAHQIHQGDSRILSQFASQETFDLKKPWAAILDCLDTTTTNALDQQFAEFSNKDGFQLFLSIAANFSFLAWKHWKNGENYTLISAGSQIGRDGVVDQTVSNRVCATLNGFHPNGVIFDPSKMNSYLTGGTCSAMTLQFLKDYRAIPKCIQNLVDDKVTGQGLNALGYNYSSSALETLKKISDKYRTSSPAFRNIQMAYNTIKQCGTPNDFKKAKMEALVKYENPTLSLKDPAEINLDPLGDITTFYNNAPEGIFVGRLLRPLLTDADFMDPTKRDKAECYGHTTLLIKEKGQVFYYDPGIGVIQVHTPAQLGLALSWQAHRWALLSIRFYQVQQSPNE